MKNNLIYNCLKELYYIEQIEESISCDIKIITNKLNELKLRKDRITKLLKDKYFEELPFDDYDD